MQTLYLRARYSDATKTGGGSPVSASRQASHDWTASVNQGGREGGGWEEGRGAGTVFLNENGSAFPAPAPATAHTSMAECI